MDIYEYVKKTGITLIEFSRRIEISESYLFMILKGSKKPSKKLIRTIERVTEGNVSLCEIVDHKVDYCEHCGNRMGLSKSARKLQRVS